MSGQMGPADDVMAKLHFVLAVLEGEDEAIGTELTLDLREVPIEMKRSKYSLAPDLRVPLEEGESKWLATLRGVVVCLDDSHPITVLSMTQDPTIREWPAGGTCWGVTAGMLVLGLFPPNRREADGLAPLPFPNIAE